MIRPEERTADRIHDALADDYGFSTTRDLPGRVKGELLRGNVTRKDRVLDVGCANGLHMREVAALCTHVTGIDINQRMLELARERLAADGRDNWDVVEASAADLPFPDGSFDLVYSYSTLLLVPDFEGALDEIARVVRPGGTALLDITGRWNMSTRHWRSWYRSQGHFGLHSRSEPALTRDLAGRGLTPVDSHAFGVLDQWRYIRGGHRLSFLDRLFHRSGRRRDLDYTASNLPGARRLASRWLITARKSG